MDPYFAADVRGIERLTARGASTSLWPMFRRIIVAFDGSPRSQDALALAQRVREPDSGELTLACVIDETPWHRAPEAVHEEVASMLADARASIPAGIPVRLRSPVAHSAARGLTELAEAEHADLIVVGSSRRGPAGRISLERTAGRLLQGAPCAVAMPPADARGGDRFRHIGIAYDGSREAESALTAGYAIAASTGAAVTLLYALPATEIGGVPANAASERAGRKARLEAQDRLDAAAAAAPGGVNPRTELLYGPPAHVIADACDGIVDLLVTGSRGYGPVQRALIGSVSEVLIERAHHPVLVLPRHRDHTSSPAETATSVTTA
jgi:nucleotide-binding universal stress UspA family protein